MRFRLAGVPVHVHFSHLLLSGFIAWSFVNSPGRGDFPGPALRDPAHPRHVLILFGVTLGWISLISLSVLLHEMGHALASRAFGGQPQITLVGLGGQTKIGEPGRYAWWEEVLITLAGPATGLAFGVLAGIVGLFGKLGVMPDAVTYFAYGTLYANLAWTVLNLLPLTMLDGGTITSLVLTRVFGRVGFLFAQFVSLGLAVIAIAFALATGNILFAIVIGMVSMRTVANISGYQRGELPFGSVAHPLNGVIERAETLYRERKLREAELLASGVVEASEVPPLIRSRAHMLLGWVQLKQGNGRKALDHFSQVQGLEVPPHALAAGFSLIGDDARAIPFWAMASQRANEATVRAEYAGALIRAGRVDEAKVVPSVDLVQAYAAAERVHYVRKEYESAAKVSEAAFELSKEPLLAYTAACAWALAGRTDDAMRLLQLARESGFHDASEARTDPDLKGLRGRPDFEAWLSSLSPGA